MTGSTEDLVFTASGLKNPALQRWTLVQIKRSEKAEDIFVEVMLGKVEICKCTENARDRPF